MGALSSPCRAASLPRSSGLHQPPPPHPALSGGSGGAAGEGLRLVVDAVQLGV
eukprot:CAMPEP_0173440832 /NCGR_PEP_ID=MMETSP1357-20121228/23633_1 /TAXON_ID=77926 /ORGANISM="Hemiselmis rufescens, Strain PCC563" /LENGTH=52 /DNA_ID=CAMNT_0014406369 /DNA_START=227 /DNA_END=385 /DNA_ORIENTATION=-